MARELTIRQQIERSIIKKYRKDLWNKFVMGVKDYKLIENGDRIAVGVSGGKDSLLMAKCLQHLQKYSTEKFELEFVFLDTGYSKKQADKAEKAFETAGVSVRKLDINIIGKAAKSGDCCEEYDRLRTKELLKAAEELGCGKLALANDFDDAIEYIFSQMVYYGRVQSLMPRLYSDDSDKVEIIRPIYMVKESFVNDWVRYNDLELVEERFEGTELADRQETKEYSERRKYVKSLIKRFRETNPNIENNLFKSVYNVNLRTVIGWYSEENRYNFLDYYEDDKYSNCGCPDELSDSEF